MAISEITEKLLAAKKAKGISLAAIGKSCDARRSLDCCGYLPSSYGIDR